jgi:hypothetical protein
LNRYTPSVKKECIRKIKTKIGNNGLTDLIPDKPEPARIASPTKSNAKTRRVTSADDLNIRILRHITVNILTRGSSS